jgi:phage terminase large subunit
MTTPTKASRTSPRAPKTAAGAMTAAVDLALTAGTIDPTSYVDDPVSFAIDVLGVTPTPGQAQVLRAAASGRRVAVRSGNRTGKSTACAMLGLWWYCTRENARVVITAPTDRQVNGVIWREVLRYVRRAKVAIPGASTIGEMARTGLKHPETFSEISGHTAREAEAISGIAGRVMYIVDEASGVADEIREAIEGNLAGAGSKLIAISNPTRALGWFSECFNNPDFAGRWVLIHLSSLEVAKLGLEGMASEEWFDDMKATYGEDSDLYKIRVLGEFCRNEEGHALSLEMIAESQVRWATTPDTGDLQIGLDPAGHSGLGDESAAAVRRGRRIVCVRTKRGLSQDEHIVWIKDLIDEFRLPEEDATCVIDRTGPIGYPLWQAMRDDKGFRALRCEIFGLDATSVPRVPKVYAACRDEMLGSLVAWVREGGALPPDRRLEADLHTCQWTHDERNRRKASSKDEMRQILKRSPDRGDAVQLAVWVTDGTSHADFDDDEREMPAPNMSPYSLEDAWQEAEQPGRAWTTNAFDNVH